MGSVIVTVIILILLLVVPIVTAILKNRGWMEIAEGTVLDENAIILGVKSEHISGFSEKIKTIVVFSDGSEYHTYLTRERRTSLRYITHTVDKEVVEEIIERAKEMHRQKALKEKDKK